MIIKKVKGTDTGLYVVNAPSTPLTPVLNTASLTLMTGSFVDIKRPFYRIVIPKSDTDIYYVVEKGYENRLDLIAYKHYGHVNYWWVIADVNLHMDAFIIKTGTILRIPTKTEVDKVLINIKNETI